MAGIIALVLVVYNRNQYRAKTQTLMQGIMIQIFWEEFMSPICLQFVKRGCQEL